MAASNVEILKNGVTLHRQVGEIIDPNTKERIGVQNGRGRVLLKGEVLPADQVSPEILDALDDEDHPSHVWTSKLIRRVSDDPRVDVAARTGLPFDGYDEADVEQIVAAMRILPSSAVARIVAYEKATQNRHEIASFNAGFGESTHGRQHGEVSSPHQEGDDKAAGELTTRDQDDEGNHIPGDGVTGTGDGNIPHGSRSVNDDEAETPKRRSRRARPAKAKAKAKSRSGSGVKKNQSNSEGSSDSDNDE